MILYFSGTGNSRYVAKKLAERTEDTLVSINERLRRRDAGHIDSERPLVFVCPIHDGRIPDIVTKHILRTPFRGNHDAYFIVTCAENPADAQSYVLKLYKKKGFRFRGFASVRMPQNDIIGKEATPRAEIGKLLEEAGGKIAALAEAVLRDEILRYETPSGKAGSLFSPLRMALRGGAKGFYATEKCGGCRECVKRCPMKNISFKDGPVWGDECVRCMACIDGCPKSAIEYGKKTQGKDRYYLEC